MSIKCVTYYGMNGVVNSSNDIKTFLDKHLEDIYAHKDFNVKSEETIKGVLNRLTKALTEERDVNFHLRLISNDSTDMFVNIEFCMGYLQLEQIIQFKSDKSVVDYFKELGGCIVPNVIVTLEGRGDTELAKHLDIFLSAIDKNTYTVQFNNYSSKHVLLVLTMLELQ